MSMRPENLQSWSASGILYTPDASGAPVGDNGFSLQATFKESGNYTVQFSMKPPANVTNYNAGLAEVIWSVAGNSIRRLVTVFNGTTISGAGESVNVKLIDVSAAQGGALAPIPYAATISVVKGVRPVIGGVQPPIYTPRDNDPPYILSASYELIDIPVPQDAGINAIFLAVSQIENEGGTQPLDVTNGMFIVEHRTLGTVLTDRYNYDGCNQWRPLTPGTRTIRCRNTSVGSTLEALSITPMFGVDG